MRRSGLAAVVTGALALVLYGATLSPTISGWDNAELVTAAHVLGIAHPTGYPIYLVLGRLFDLLPFGNTAVRLALLSAVCAASASALIAWAAARITSSVVAGMLAGAIAAANLPLWSQATEGEVYALNALIVALAIAVFVRWTFKPRPRDIVWLALIAGIGLAHHRTALFFTGPLLLIAAVAQRPGWKVLGKAALVAAAPLLSYLYLPLRSAANPPLMWSDLTQWDHFVSYVTAEVYAQAYAFARPRGDMVAVAWDLMRELGSQITVAGLALVGIGIVSLFRKSRKLCLSLMFSVALLSLWNLSYQVSDVIVFFIPCALAAALWAGEGLRATVAGVESRLGRGKAGVAVGGIALLMVSASLLGHNWAECSHRNDWRHYDLGYGMLAQLAPDSILVTNHFMPEAMYLQQVEGLRLDVEIVNPTGYYQSGISDRRIVRLLAALPKKYSPNPSDSDAEKAAATVRFAAALGRHTQWRRPVYCAVDGLRRMGDLPAQALGGDLFRVGPEAPSLLVQASGGLPRAQFEGGIALARVELQPGTAQPRDLLRLSFDWSCGQAMETPPVVFVHLSPADRPAGEPAPRGLLLDHATWLAYGLSPLAATPEGMVYHQEMVITTPTNAPAGSWAILVGLGSESGGQVRLQRVAEFRVLPASDPRSAEGVAEP